MKKKTLEKVEEMQEKYFQLVWFARKRPEDLYNPVCAKPMQEVMFLYPQDVKDLEREEGNWHHGFNSGMLAATRFFLEAECGSFQFALDEFPCLDS